MRNQKKVWLVREKDTIPSAWNWFGDEKIALFWAEERKGTVEGRFAIEDNEGNVYLIDKGMERVSLRGQEAHDKLIKQCFIKEYDEYCTHKEMGVLCELQN